MISSATVTSLVIIASNFNGLTAGTQRFINCGVVGRETIVVGGCVLDWFLDFFSEGDRHSGDRDWRGGSLFNKGGSYGPGMYLTLF